MDYRKAIQEFVGEGGRIYLTEHSFAPKVCNVATQHHVNLIGHKTTFQPISKLSNEVAREVYRDLIEYQEYCKTYA